MVNKKFSELTVLGTKPANDDIVAFLDSSGTEIKSVRYDNLGFLDTTGGTITGFIDMAEIATPADPAVDHVRLYAIDNNGFTQLAYKINGVAESVIQKAFSQNITASDSKVTNKLMSDFVADGTADDVELQLALDGISASIGGMLKIMQGGYDITATLVGVANKSMIGETKKSVLLTRNASMTATEMLDWKNDEDLELGHFTLDDNNAAVPYDNGLAGLGVTGGQQVYVHDIEVKNVIRIGIALGGSGVQPALDVTAERLTSSDNVDPGVASGSSIWIGNGNASPNERIILTESLTVHNFGAGVFYQKTEGFINAMNWYVDNHYGDSGGQLNISDAASKYGMISMNFIKGITPTDAQGVENHGTDLIFSSNISFQNARHGFQNKSDGGYTLYIGNVAKNNSQETIGVFSGFNFEAGHDHIIVMGSRAYDDQGTKRQEHGIQLEGGATDFIILVGNDLVDFEGSVAINDLATGVNKQIFGNLPFSANTHFHHDGVASVITLGGANSHLDIGDGALPTGRGINQENDSLINWRDSADTLTAFLKFDTTEKFIFDIGGTTLVSADANQVAFSTGILNVNRLDDTHVFLYLTHNATTTDNERLADFNIRGQDDLGGTRTYAGFVGRAETVANLAIDGSLNIFVAENNVNTTYIALDANPTLRKVSIFKELTMSTNKITDVVDPTAAQDAATMNYVDTHQSHIDSFDFIIYDNGGLFTAISGLNGSIDSTNADFRTLLNALIASMTVGGSISIKSGTANFDVSGGINIGVNNVHIYGDTLTNTSDVATPRGVVFESTTASDILVSVTATESGLHGIQFRSSSTGQTGLKLTDSQRGNYSDLSFQGAFDQALHLRGEVALTNGNEFHGKIHIQGAAVGIVFNANSMVSGDSIAATVNHFEYVVISGGTDKGIWFENKADGNVFDYVQIASPSTAGYTNVVVGSATGVSISGNYIGRLLAGTNDVTDVTIEVFEDTTQTGHVPLTVACLTRDGVIPTNVIVLNANAHAPVILANINSSDDLRGMRVNEVIISGIAETVPLQTQRGTRGTLRIPVENGQPNDTHFGNVDGSIGFDSLNGNPYYRDTTWKKFAVRDQNNFFTASQTITTVGTVANWTSIRDEELNSGDLIAQYNFNSRDLADAAVVKYGSFNWRVSTKGIGTHDGWFTIAVAQNGTIDEEFMIMRGNLTVPIIFKKATEFDGNDLSNAIGVGQTATQKIATVDSGTTSLLNTDQTGDGTDDDVEFSLAVSALPALGGSVELMEGTYDWTTTRNTSSDIHIKGQGIGNTTIFRNYVGASTRPLRITDTQDHVVISDLTIDGNEANLVGESTMSELFIQGDDVILSNLEIKNINSVGIVFNGANRILINNLIATDSALGPTSARALAFNVNMTFDWYLIGGILKDNLTNGALHNRVQRSSYIGVSFIDNSTADNGGQLGFFDNSIEATLMASHMFGGDASSQGLEVHGERTISIGNTFDEQGRYGTLIFDNPTSPTDKSHISMGNIYHNNGQDADFPAIRATVATAGVDQTDHFLIIGNIAYDDRGTPHQTYGFHAAADTDSFIVALNDFTRNKTGGILDESDGVEKQIFGNIPYDSNTHFHLDGVNAELSISGTGRLLLDGAGGNTGIREDSDGIIILEVNGTDVFQIAVNATQVFSAGGFFGVGAGKEVRLWSGSVPSIRAVTSSQFMVRPTGTTDSFSVQAVGIGIVATTEIFLDGVAATGDTSIRESAPDIVAIKAGDTDSLFIDSSSIYIPAAASIWLDGKINTRIFEALPDDVRIEVGGQNGLILDEDGTEVDVVFGANNVLLTTEVQGFVWLPSAAGTPTGTPTNSFAGKIPMQVDATNDIMYIYSNGAWRNVGSGGGGLSLTTKGELHTYTTTDFALPIGSTDGHVLTVDAAEASGMKWAAVGAADNLGNHLATQDLDMNGNDIIIDVDADSRFKFDIDDQITINLGTVDVLRITNDDVEILSGSLAIIGNNVERLELEGLGGDTSIRATGSDRIIFEMGGDDEIQFVAQGSGVQRATQGNFRVPNDWQMAWRNAADTANISVEVSQFDEFSISEANFRIERSTTSVAIALFRDETVADNTVISSIVFQADNDGSLTTPHSQNYAQFTARVQTDVEDAEDGEFNFGISRDGIANYSAIRVDAANDAVDVALNLNVLNGFDLSIAATRFIRFEGQGSDSTIGHNGAGIMGFTIDNSQVFVMTATSLRMVNGIDLWIDPQDKLFFDSGGDTFIYEVSPDVLAFSIGAVEKITMTPTQLITIATTTTAGLRVETDGTNEEAIQLIGNGLSTDKPRANIIMNGQYRIAGDLKQNFAGIFLDKSNTTDDDRNGEIVFAVSDAAGVLQTHLTLVANLKSSFRGTIAMVDNAHLGFSTDTLYHMQYDSGTATLQILPNNDLSVSFDAAGHMVLESDKRLYFDGLSGVADDNFIGQDVTNSIGIWTEDIKRLRIFGGLIQSQVGDFQTYSGSTGGRRFSNRYDNAGLGVMGGWEIRSDNSAAEDEVYTELLGVKDSAADGFESSTFEFHVRTPAAGVLANSFEIDGNVKLVSVINDFSFFVEASRTADPLFEIHNLDTTSGGDHFLHFDTETTKANLPGAKFQFEGLIDAIGTKQVYSEIVFTSNVVTDGDKRGSVVFKAADSGGALLTSATFTSTALFLVGSVVIPQASPYYMNGSLSTYMYSPSLDLIRFITAGTTRMGISPAGDLAMEDGGKVFFDGINGVGSDTYIHQVSADILQIVVGTEEVVDFLSSGNGIINAKTGATMQWEDSTGAVAGIMAASTANTDFSAVNGNQFRIITEDTGSTSRNRIQVSGNLDATAIVFGDNVSDTFVYYNAPTAGASHLVFRENGAYDFHIKYDTVGKKIQFDEAIAGQVDEIEFVDVILNMNNNNITNIGTGTITTLTEEAVPVAGDFIFGFEATSGAMRKFDIGNLPAGGGGEINTHSSDGGGTVLTAATPKVGVDLRLVSIATTGPLTHSVTTDLMTFDINDLVDADLATGVFASITGIGVQTQDLDMNGNDIITDVDGDTRIKLNQDDDIIFYKNVDDANMLEVFMWSNWNQVSGETFAQWKFNALSDMGTLRTWASWGVIAQTADDTTEDTLWFITGMQGGSLLTRLQYDGSVGTTGHVQILNADFQIPAGNFFYLDGGSDTSIRQSTADVIMFEIGSFDLFSLHAGDGTTLASQGNFRSSKNFEFAVRNQANDGDLRLEFGDQFNFRGQSVLFERNDAGVGFTIRRNEVVGDFATLGFILFKGLDDAPADQQYSEIRATMRDDAAAQPLGTIQFLVVSDATNPSVFMEIHGGNTDIDFLRDIDMAAGQNIKVNTTTGTMLAITTAQRLGFWGSAPITQPTVSGERDANPALASLLTQLDTAGLINDTTTAGSGGAGEINTHSSLGGGTVLTAAVPKSGVDLQLISIATTGPLTHSVSTDLLTFDINDLVDADISASAAIALSKLATDPLARANHTGTQLAATISDFSHALLSTEHSDTLAGTVVQGDLIIGNATPAWSRLGIGAIHRFLQSDGTDPSWVVMSGDASLVAGVLTIGTSAVDDGKIASHTSTKITITAKGQLAGTIAYEDEANAWGAFDQNIATGGQWEEGGVGISPIGIHDIYVSATGMWESTTGGSAVLTKLELATDQDIQSLDFDGSSIEAVQFSVALPKNWNAGTITATFYWTSAAGDTDDVDWRISGVSIGDNVLLTTGYGAAITVTDAHNGTANELNISVATAAITIAGAGKSELCRFLIERVGSADTMTEDAKLLGVMLHITTDAATAV